MSASVHPPATPPPPRPATAYQSGHSRPGPQGGPSRTRLLLAVGGVAVLALAILLVAVLAGGSSNDTSDGSKPAAAHSIAAAMAGQQTAQFEIVSGAESVTVRTADIGNDLYRASTPKDSSLIPTATMVAEKVQLTLGTAGSTGPATVEVLLNPAVTWQLRLAGGGMKETIDFSSGKITVLELGAGAGDIDVTLPKAQGTLAVRLTGGAGNLKVHLPQGQPVQFKVNGAGAGTATIDGKTSNNVKAGTELSSPDFAKAADRYAIEATVGVSTLVVDRK